MRGAALRSAEKRLFGAGMRSLLSPPPHYNTTSYIRVILFYFRPPRVTSCDAVYLSIIQSTVRLCVRHRALLLEQLSRRVY